MKVSKSNRKFCINCKYRILITSEEAELTPIFISYTISGEVQSINTTSHWPNLGLINSDGPVCYSYEIDNNLKSENLILSVTTFSGGLNKLYVSPWKYISTNDLPSAKLNYLLHEEEVIKITPESRKDNNIEIGKLYLCFDSIIYYDTTFTFKIIPESKVEESQRFNYIINGVSVNGYLPHGKVTKYSVMDFSTTANITLKLETVSGSPILFANFTENNYHLYSKAEIEINKDKLLGAKTNGNIQTIEITSDQNPCHKKNKLSSKPNYRCGVIAIIYCNSTVECVYRISDKSRKSHNFLKEQ